jgi:hypothetical protein
MIDQIKQAVSECYEGQRLHFYILVLAILVVVGVRLNLGPQTMDDAFITFRYALNAASGEGLVYNAGEWVLGTTTPLYASMLAAFQMAGGDITWTSLILNALFDATSICLIYALTLRITGSGILSITTAVSLAASWMVLWISVGGMESSFFMMLSLITILSVSSDRRYLTGILCGFLTLVRPEGSLMISTVCLIRLIETRRLPYREIVGYAIVLLPWIAYAYGIYGSPVPHSVQAKAVLGNKPALHGIKRILGFLGQTTWPFISVHASRALQYAFSILTVVTMAAALIRGRHDRLTATFWGFPLVFVSAYAAGSSGGEVWYAIPLVPFAILASLLAIFSVANRLQSQKPKLAKYACVVFAILTVGSVATRDSAIDLAGREGVFLKMANVIAPRIAAGDTVMCPEIGVLGYYLPDAYIYDTQGLVSPNAIPYQTGAGQFNGSIPENLINEVRPHFIAGLEVFIRETPSKPWFKAAYNQIGRFESRALGTDGAEAYQRVLTP